MEIKREKKDHHPDFKGHSINVRVTQEEFKAAALAAETLASGNVSLLFRHAVREFIRKQDLLPPEQVASNG